MPGRFLAAMAAQLLVATSLAAQFPPDSLKNLQVFPRGIPVRQLINEMRAITGALGVRCQYCHVGEEGRPLEEFDFASDEKRTKQAARVMLEMVNTINGTHLPAVPDRGEPRVEVTCMTCHRGITRPRMLEDVIFETIAAHGLDSARAEYRALRQEYYGSAAYDFQEWVLNEVGTRLLRAGNPDAALGTLDLNAEFFPESSDIAFIRGEAYRVKGDTAAAIVHYERAAELAPARRQGIERLIRRLRGAP